MGYKLIEVCSSGLTHLLRDGYPTTENYCNAVTPRFYVVTNLINPFQESEIYMEHNFAMMEIQPVESDVEIRVVIKNYYNEDVFERKYLLKKDFEYDA